MGHARITFVYFKVFYISVSSGDDSETFYLSKFLSREVYKAG